MPIQVQRDALEAPIKAWVDNNPGTECSKHNGRRQLFDHVKAFYRDNCKKDLKDPQVSKRVSKLLSKLRGGVIKPEFTSNRYIKKAVGAPGAYSKVETNNYNKKTNPKNNPIHNQKRKDENDVKKMATTIDNRQ
jgi:hypothetical protein